MAAAMGARQPPAGVTSKNPPEPCYNSNHNKAPLAPADIPQTPEGNNHDRKTKRNIIKNLRHLEQETEVKAGWR